MNTDEEMLSVKNLSPPALAGKHGHKSLCQWQHR